MKCGKYFILLLGSNLLLRNVILLLGKKIKAHNCHYLLCSLAMCSEEKLRENWMGQSSSPLF